MIPTREELKEKLTSLLLGDDDAAEKGYAQDILAAFDAQAAALQQAEAERDALDIRWHGYLAESIQYEAERDVLQVSLTVANRNYNAMQAERDAARARVERLEKALEKIDDMCEWRWGNPPIGLVARAALGAE